jgi:hypothetical protein
MKNTLYDSDPLYDVLLKLIGLNLAVSDFNVNSEFDIKHIIKCLYHLFLCYSMLIFDFTQGYLLFLVQLEESLSMMLL